MNKPITPEEMETYVDTTWKRCQSEAWAEPVAHCTLEQLAWLQRVVPSTGTIALYTTAPQRKPLSDEQRDAIAKQAAENDWRDYEIIDAVEAAHGIKE